MGVVWDTGLASPVTTNMEDCESLLRKYDSRIRRIASRFSFRADDAAQVGRLALIRAAERWLANDNNKASFWVYARHRVFWAMADYVKTDRAQQPVSSNSGEDVEGLVDPSASPEVRCEVNEHVDRLDEEESEVFLRHVHGEDVRSIARDMQKSKSVIHRTLKAAVHELRYHA